MPDLLIAPYGVKNGQANKPNPTQRKALSWVDSVRRGEKSGGGIPTLLLMGGVGSGKSRAVLAPVIEMLVEVPGIRILWGRKDFKDIKLSIMDKFFEILPRELIADKSEQYHWYDIIQREGTRGRIYFNELKDLGGLGSQEFGVIVVTEAHECNEQTYRTLKRRCRQENVPNMILMESEPPNEGHWLAQITDKTNPMYDKDVERWEVSTYENWPNLPESYKNSLEGMPEAWKKKYLYGKCGFIPDGTPFYSGFTQSMHVADLQWNPLKDLIIGLDFGFHHPAAVFSQIDDYDRWNLLKEFMPSDVTVDKFADAVTAIINKDFPGSSPVFFGDPACRQVNDKSEQTSWQILASKGIVVRYVTSDYRSRKEIIERKLTNLAAGKPQLMVDLSCRVIIDGFLGGYHYPVFENGMPFGFKNEVPFRDGYYEHLMNAMEYIAVNLFRPVERKAHMSYREPVAVRMDNL